MRWAHLLCATDSASTFALQATVVRDGRTSEPSPSEPDPRPASLRWL